MREDTSHSCTRGLSCSSLKRKKGNFSTFILIRITVLLCCFSSWLCNLLSFMEVIFYITLKIKWNISDVVMNLLQSSVPWSTISHGWLKVHIFTSQIMPAFFTFLYLIKQDLVESNQSTNHWLWCRCNKKYNHCHDVKRINLIVSIKWLLKYPQLFLRFRKVLQLQKLCIKCWPDTLSADVKSVQIFMILQRISVKSLFKMRKNRMLLHLHIAILQ